MALSPYRFSCFWLFSVRFSPEQDPEQHQCCRYQRRKEDVGIGNKGCGSIVIDDHFRMLQNRLSDKRPYDAGNQDLREDADALQHCLRNPMEDFWYGRGRVPAILKELGVE